LRTAFLKNILRYVKVSDEESGNGEMKSTYYTEWL